MLFGMRRPIITGPSAAVSAADVAISQYSSCPACGEPFQLDRVAGSFVARIFSRPVPFLTSRAAQARWAPQRCVDAPPANAPDGPEAPYTRHLRSASLAQARPTLAAVALTQRCGWMC
jgi:hypothetical protein